MESFIPYVAGVIMAAIYFIITCKLENLERTNFYDILLGIVKVVKVKNIHESDIKKIIATLSIKLLIELSLTKVSEIEDSTYFYNKKELSKIVQMLSEISKELKSKEISLEELKSYLFIVLDIKTMLYKVL
jgi:hypothetical protein